MEHASCLSSLRGRGVAAPLSFSLVCSAEKPGSTLDSLQAEIREQGIMGIWKPVRYLTSIRRRLLLLHLTPLIVLLVQMSNCGTGEFDGEVVKPVHNAVLH